MRNDWFILSLAFQRYHWNGKESIRAIWLKKECSYMADIGDKHALLSFLIYLCRVGPVLVLFTIGME